MVSDGSYVLQKTRRLYGGTKAIYEIQKSAEGFTNEGTLLIILC